MKRNNLKDLSNWKKRKNRKPLVIRGARQVGKTWIVREFGKSEFKNIVEINFDKHKGIASLFDQPDTHMVLKNLELELNVDIKPGHTLLFLDEIQSAPKVLARLRYFFEDMPDLHIIAAGSLLEFLLEEHDFSMPVGRIEYLFLGPMTFEEFLSGLKEEKLVGYLNQFTFEDSIQEPIHQKLMTYVKSFFIVGGMPGVVDIFREHMDYREALREQQSILQTYVDDFNKYHKRVHQTKINSVFQRIPALIGQKLKYVNLDRSETSAKLSQAIHLLELARVIYCVKHTAGNGLPFEAEANDRNYKTLFLDIGLVQSSLNLQYSEILHSQELISVNSGALAEQYVGQHLLYNTAFFEKPSLYYWNREKKSSTAEIDYLISNEGEIIPVEVKAGKTGSLKSLHLFISKKKSRFAIKFSSSLPAYNELETILPGLEQQTFTLLSLPFYLIGQYRRLISNYQRG